MKGAALAFGFLGIGLALFGFAAFIGLPALQEARIGRGLVDTGETAQALVVNVERLERSQCDRSQRFICTSSVSHIATVVFQVDGLRSGAELRVNAQEYEAYIAGGEVFVPLTYLPSDPSQVERDQGTRLARAEGEALNVIVLCIFGLTFTLIGGVAALVNRKRHAAPSTGPDA